MRPVQFRHDIGLMGLHVCYVTSLHWPRHYQEQGDINSLLGPRASPEVLPTDWKVGEVEGVFWLGDSERVALFEYRPLRHASWSGLSL